MLLRAFYITCWLLVDRLFKKQDDPTIAFLKKIKKKRASFGRAPTGSLLLGHNWGSNQILAALARLGWDLGGQDQPCTDIEAYL